VDIVNRSIDQFSAGFAIWRVTDQVIVYANQHALAAFGGTTDFFGKTSLWDIIGPLDTNLILAESIRSSPHGGPDIHLPDEAFVTFKRLDNGELFSGWFKAKDIVEEDGNINFRAVLIFTNYDSNEGNSHFDSFIKTKAQLIERELAGKVAHDINNALAILKTEIESLSTVHGLNIHESLSNSFHRLHNIGLDMRRLAHISESLSEVNENEITSLLMPDASKTMERPVSLLRVLVVDDEPELTAGLCTVFEMRSLWTQSAHSKNEALARAHYFKPQAALIDIRLGDEDGTDVASALREVIPNITIVYMTGYSSLLPAITANSTNTVLKKPFEIDAAISALMKGQK
jgi:CheY-like chemotaxis protein